MELQTTIYDFLEDEELTLYDKCLVPGIYFKTPAGNMLERHKDMKVVTDEQTGKGFFLISLEIVKENKSKVSFFYQAMDGYWGGDYATDDFTQIKRSIYRLSNEIRRELGSDYHTAPSCV